MAVGSPNIELNEVVSWWEARLVILLRSWCLRRYLVITSAAESVSGVGRVKSRGSVRMARRRRHSCCARR